MKVLVETKKVPDENEKALDWKWKVPVKVSTWRVDEKKFQDVDQKVKIPLLTSTQCKNLGAMRPADTA